MAKKLICFPFENGNLLEWVNHNLSDENREKVYNGEEVRTGSWREDGDEIEWRPNTEVELTLHYEGYGRGRSAVTFYWTDDDGHRYPMFIKDVDGLLKENIGSSMIHAVFTYVKRGSNYGIKFLRKANNEMYKM